MTKLSQAQEATAVAEEEEELRQKQQDQQQQHHEEQQVAASREQPYVERPQPGSNDSSASNKPKRNPFCSRCRNHGKSAQVKGHKRHCEYRDCQCEGCKLVECRQIVSAAQIKRRRDQKQDEECGRRIEISPPVLKQGPASDPAALIAKTLIAAKHPHITTTTATTAAGAATTVAGAAVAASVVPTVHPPHHNHPLGGGPLTPNGQLKSHHLVNHFVNQVADSVQHHHHQHPNHHHHHHLQQMAAAAAASRAQLPHVGGPTTNGASHDLASSAALINALHLFQLPSPMQQQPPPHPAGMPSVRDQLQLVEEIHELYGPLAIYALLRQEQFNLTRVRELIELSRAPFDELIQRVGGSGGGGLPTNSSSPASAAAVQKMVPETMGGGDCVAGGESGAPGAADQAYQVSHHQNGSTSVPTSSVAATAAAATTASASVSHHLSPALNSLPMSTAQSLWPGLKLATNGATLHPHHFLPHFMHHHHHILFNANHQSQAHHNHHHHQPQQQQQHHHHQHLHQHQHHQQVSLSSTITNLSTSTPSSSNVSQ